MVEVERVAALYVDGETAGLDEDCAEPVLLCAEEGFGEAEVGVDVGGGGKEDGAEPAG